MREPRWSFVVVAFWLAVLLLPRPYDLWGDGNLEGFLARLRFEDALAPLLAVYVLMRWRCVVQVVGAPLISVIIIWVTYCILFTLVNCYSRDVPVSVGISYASKEIQYLIYFAFFAAFTANNPSISILIIPGMMLTPSLIFMLWQVWTGTRLGYYGVAAVWELARPTSSEVGAVFGVLSSAAAGFFLGGGLSRFRSGGYVTRGLAGLYVFTLILCTVLTGSKTGIGGIVAASVVLTVVSGRRLLGWLAVGGSSVKVEIFYPSVVVLGGLTFWLILPDSELIGQRLESESLIYTYEERRGGYEHYLTSHFGDAYVDPFAIIVGTGLGSPNFISGYSETMGISLGVDSQYVRRLLEVGIVGVVVWISLLWMIGITIWTRAGASARGACERVTLGAIVACVLVMSLGHEVFQLIRGASVIYSVLGVLLGASYRRHFLEKSKLLGEEGYCCRKGR